MRTFILNRTRDITGVSGTGIVAEGVEFTDGKVVLRWLSTHPSFEEWDSIADLVAIHGHDGASQVEWRDELPLGVAEAEAAVKAIWARVAGRRAI